MWDDVDHVQEEFGIGYIGSGATDFAANRRRQHCRVQAGLRFHHARDQSTTGKKYAYGASQLLPLLAYHLQTDMSEFAAILDRSDTRIGKYFPGLPVPIIHPHNATDIAKSAVLITAVDSSRDILPNLIALNPQTIVRGVFSIN